MSASLAYEPICTLQPDTFLFSYPPSVAEKRRMAGFSMSIREFFLHFAKVEEDRDPKHSALLREAASHYPDVDGAYVLERDRNGNVVFDYDDWDELSEEHKVNRGNRQAAIAALDKLRLDLELMSDESKDKETVNHIRQSLAKLASN